MNQLTTIAAMPSGAGQAAHLAPEVGAQRSPADTWAESNDAAELLDAVLAKGRATNPSAEVYNALGKAANP